MEHMDQLAARFDGAMMTLPGELRSWARQLTKEERAAAEEIRLRLGRPGTVVLPGGERPFTPRPVVKGDLDGALAIATQASAHTVRDALCAGYVTLRGGYRIGVCGTAVTQEGEIRGFRAVSSLAVRISREIPGAAAPVAPQLREKGRWLSTLVLSPPGGGKTTLLRDLVRLISDGEPAAGIAPWRVALADERSEVAALWDGVPQLDVGAKTDVLEGCPKSKAVMLLLRAMNPQVIALDEITSPEDIAAMRHAANCGVVLFATAHGEDVADLKRRELYRSLLALGIFRRAVVIRREGGARRYQVEPLEVET